MSNLNQRQPHNKSHDVGQAHTNRIWRVETCKRALNPTLLPGIVKNKV